MLFGCRQSRLIPGARCTQASDSLQARVSAAAGADATVHRIGSCDGATAAPLRGHALPDLSGGGSGSGGPAVVLVCASAQDTLEDEAATLGALLEASAGKRYLFVYASEPAVRPGQLINGLLRYKCLRT